MKISITIESAENGLVLNDHVKRNMHIASNGQDMLEIVRSLICEEATETMKIALLGREGGGVVSEFRRGDRVVLNDGTRGRITGGLTDAPGVPISYDVATDDGNEVDVGPDELRAEDGDVFMGLFL